MSKKVRLSCLRQQNVHFWTFYCSVYLPAPAHAPQAESINAAQFWEFLSASPVVPAVVLLGEQEVECYWQTTDLLSCQRRPPHSAWRSTTPPSSANEPPETASRRDPHPQDNGPSHLTSAAAKCLRPIRRLRWLAGRTHKCPVKTTPAPSSGENRRPSVDLSPSHITRQVGIS